MLILLLLLLQSFNFFLQFLDKRLNGLNILFRARERGLQLECVAVGPNILLQRIDNLLQGFRRDLLILRLCLIDTLFGISPIQRTQFGKSTRGIDLSQLVK